MTHQPTTWRKSTFSDGTVNCVELAEHGADVLVRDSKHPNRGHLAFTRAELAALVAGIQQGEYDDLTG